MFSQSRRSTELGPGVEVFFRPKGCLQAIGNFDLFVYAVEMALDRMAANIK